MATDSISITRFEKIYSDLFAQKFEHKKTGLFQCAIELKTQEEKRLRGVIAAAQGVPGAGVHRKLLRLVKRLKRVIKARERFEILSQNKSIPIPSQKIPALVSAASPEVQNPHQDRL